ncbi:WYL domain-containing protein [Saccharibacillus sp. JS10]|uniref:WYL domain-containing protein n=1 Tax=Saccharibacillus sp. JS10 TaxID=2950552 RepID=UPI00210962AE|nr:WYL domain-containing protein [Saccharibacillus sp. JS10]MCQ4086529.1 WYL domain-containing protein [Saccharibacillus sp. JS10]
MSHLFEKIFNYQLSSRLQETGVYALTSQERAWLKSMLEHPAAQEALQPETIDKLQECTIDEEMPNILDRLEQKAGSRETQVFQPWLPTIRELMRQHQSMTIQCRTKKGKLNDPQPGIPCKLEYSMVKREWYLYWYNSQTRSLLHTRLIHIVSLEAASVSQEDYDQQMHRAQKLLQAPRHEATVEVLPIFNPELTRILHAFSCFDKRVEYDEERRTYRIHLTFTFSESQFVLTKLRFLGKRVRVVEGDYLKHRMRETARKALALYQTDSEEDQTIHSEKEILERRD